MSHSPCLLGGPRQRLRVAPRHSHRHSATGHKVVEITGEGSPLCSSSRSSRRRIYRGDNEREFSYNRDHVRGAATPKPNAAILRTSAERIERGKQLRAPQFKLINNYKYLQVFVILAVTTRSARLLIDRAGFRLVQAPTGAPQTKETEHVHQYCDHRANCG